MFKQKKFLAGAAAAALLLSFGATTAFASDTWQGRWCTDANGDGICDHAVSNCQFLDANQDGVCDRCGLTCHGTWLDADGDGVCDHYTAGTCGSHHGSGHGYGHGHGRHCR